MTLSVAVSADSYYYLTERMVAEMPSGKMISLTRDCGGLLTIR